MAKELSRNFSRRGKEFSEAVQRAARLATKEGEDLANSLSDVPAGVNRLSLDEIEACYAEAGLTKASILSEVEELIAQKEKPALMSSQSMELLSDGISRGTDTMVAQDNTLAGSIQNGQF